MAIVRLEKMLPEEKKRILADLRREKLKLDGKDMSRDACNFREKINIEKQALAELPLKDRLLVMAVARDDVKKAYWLLRLGANANTKMKVGKEVSEGYGLSIVEQRDNRIVASCEPPLYFATSEAMEILLKKFGGKTSAEMKEKWAQERKLAKEQKLLEARVSEETKEREKQKTENTHMNFLKKKGIFK